MTVVSIETFHNSMGRAVAGEEVGVAVRTKKDEKKILQVFSAHRPLIYTMPLYIIVLIALMISAISCSAHGSWHGGQSSGAAADGCYGAL